MGATVNGQQQHTQGGDTPTGLLEGISHEGLKRVLLDVQSRDPDQPEFLSAVKEVAQSLQPVFERQPELLRAFEVMCEPERQIIFRVPWLDDQGTLCVNRGYRVQFSSAIGPYKGGLRFREGVNLSVIKFLGFEQMFKNALTTLPMGAGKGGSDFDPKDKSDAEIQRFCQSFMTELYRHIGGRTDIPAGDIGCGAKEIGYLYGQFKRITGLFTGALTGKGLDFGGSEIRPEATGYGVVFFAECALADAKDSIRGKRCLVSGSGNVAQFCSLKLVESGAVVLAMSDSHGTVDGRRVAVGSMRVYEPDGFSREQVHQVMSIKASHSGRLTDYKSDTCSYIYGAKPWAIDTPVDMAFPCATQHEVCLQDAQLLVQHGCKYLFEGANMPCTDRAVHHLEDNGVLFGPGKAANAGGVAVSGLEMVQNRVGLYWSREEVNAKLKEIMQAIYKTSKEAADAYGVSLASGASIASFKKVAEAVLAQGAV